jgi:hypothetical protein
MPKQVEFFYDCFGEQLYERRRISKCCDRDSPNKVRGKP